MALTNHTLDFLGGKKYVIIWIVLAIATACLFIKSNGKAIAGFLEWAGFVGVILGFYFTAEVKEKKDIMVEATKLEVAKLEVNGEQAK